MNYEGIMYIRYISNIHNMHDLKRRHHNKPNMLWIHNTHKHDNIHNQHKVNIININIHNQHKYTATVTDDSRARLPNFYLIIPNIPN